jgi:beta-glucosidase/6-phospho-beta-glucosidase/beta-galactosidase
MKVPDPQGIAFYKGILAEMKKQGITPFGTLFHFATPAWFFKPDAAGKKGWERKDAMEHWQRYVSAVAENFVPDIEQWCTLNEPLIRSYIHWSLFDNFEWAEGFTARFGLVAVDYENGFKRVPRPSAKLYTDIAKANGLSAEMLRNLGQP